MASIREGIRLVDGQPFYTVDAMGKLCGASTDAVKEWLYDNEIYPNFNDNVEDSNGMKRQTDYYSSELFGRFIFNVALGSRAKERTNAKANLERLAIKGPVRFAEDILGKE